jgi:hypothetical protein
MLLAFIGENLLSAQLGIFFRLYIVPEYSQGWREDQGRPLDNMPWSDCAEVCKTGCQGKIPLPERGIQIHYAITRGGTTLFQNRH